ncbi:hypothetical protein [Natrinema hispanicum]|uniref:Uncharacterized protein n=1 Tax=Natrinema hispanicum TaxID=392421 RepID=A0A1I0E9A7_9EURY|nr:hypothetical protein [Natrinema hispanicum]SDC66800.1 hypothetical protein SAMN05192552_100640 [Natrinema hispanicum]SET41784.1 hypothetical protein SAMN04488694_106155 [Natrinema hispanicum]
MGRSLRPSDDDLWVSADVLGAFGVTLADLEHAPASDRSLEAALADTLAAGVDRTTVLRRTITRSDRGLACSARYATADLESELVAVFEAIGWSLSVSHTRDGLALTAADHHDRRRETTVTYPDTPLGTDNLPAVLWAINDAVLDGTDARFVLLSSGVDRWRAALIDKAELEQLRDRYGPRIDAVEQPLCPEYGPAAYVPDAPANDAIGAATGEPWPPWALERDTRRTGTQTESDSVDSLIDEAEPSTDTDAASVSGGANEIDGFELRGTPARSRNDDTDGVKSTEGTTSTDADDFGTLSGTSQTARVTNDAFGTDVDCGSDDDRYRALGAALDAGGTVSVRGLLEDDDFLPELPATESEEVRIEFTEEFDPAAIPEATATAEEEGFEWVDSGSLETTRVPNG